MPASLAEDLLFLSLLSSLSTHFVVVFPHQQNNPETFKRDILANSPKLSDILTRATLPTTVGREHLRLLVFLVSRTSYMFSQRRLFVLEHDGKLGCLLLTSPSRFAVSRRANPR